MHDNFRNSNDLPPSAVEALRQGRKIEAIRIVRRVRGFDLNQAKNAVDAFVKSEPALSASMRRPRGDTGVGRLILAAVLVGLVVAVLYLIA
ncbi:MAG: hypothetical protein R3268_04490 [Acidiferrobacterales bacterium]|nr:hypothetical protein [Acidiferrobacterales bacterium]